MALSDESCLLSHYVEGCVTLDTQGTYRMHYGKKLVENVLANVLLGHLGSCIDVYDTVPCSSYPNFVTD